MLTQSDAFFPGCGNLNYVCHELRFAKPAAATKNNTAHVADAIWAVDSPWYQLISKTRYHPKQRYFFYPSIYLW
ncbi:hypothetical protein FHS10_004619 [Mucilaginibacter dorajii]|nr:hypothetical protein [Mucilaginibacter dorajii]